MSTAATDPRTGARPTTARWALSVALILGVLGMHALLSPSPGLPAGAASTAAMTSEVAPAMAPEMAPAMSSELAPAMLAHPGAGTPEHRPVPGCGHSALSPCLAVLTSLIGLAVLILLTALPSHWFTSARTPDRLAPGPQVPANRPPPWTVPSLHQLSRQRV